MTENKQCLCLLWPSGDRTWTYHGLLFGQTLWINAALVIQLVPCIGFRDAL